MLASCRTVWSAWRNTLVQTRLLSALVLMGALCMLLSLVAFSASQTVSDWYAWTNNGWTNPEAMAADGGTAAVGIPIDAGWLSVWLESASDFSIPLTATVTGVEVRVDAHSPDGGWLAPYFHDSSGNRIIISQFALPPTETTFVFGGPGKMFGQIWTPASLNERAGCMISAIGAGLTVIVDYVSFTAYYADLTPPADVSATSRTYNDKIVVSWSAVTGATSYNIWRADAWDAWALVGTATSTSYVDMAIVAHNVYAYKVQAVAPGGESELSSVAYGVAGACPPTTYPTGTSASDNEFTDKIRITWDPTPYATKYNVYRAPYEYTGIHYTKIAAVHDPWYDDTSAEPGKLYKYKIQAEWYHCGSLTSGVDAGSRKLSPPTGTSASDAAFVDWIVVTWDAVAGVDSYAVLRGEDSAGPFVEIGTSSTTTYEDLAAPCSAWYAVQAVGVGGASDPSDPDFGSRIDDQPPVLVVPTDITIECDDSCDPSFTGQATATDNCDPAPAVSYSDTRTATRNISYINRLWTATDVAGNVTSGVQQIGMSAPNATVTSQYPVWVTSLPASISVDFTIEKCAISAWLWSRCNEDLSVHFHSPEGPVIADGVAVNTQVIDLPLGAPEGTYQLIGINTRPPTSCISMFRRVGPDFLYGIDLTPPVDPTVSSTTHTVGAWSNNPEISVVVSGATDAVSGVDGFEVAWNQSAAWTPTQAKTHEETWGGGTFTAAADGDWYLHLATADNAGNWTGTVHLGPFWIDTTPPEFAGCPEDLTWYAARSEMTASVYWDLPTVTDNLDSLPVLVATAAPGDVFPLGETVVSYEATDAAGNTTLYSFVITVLEQVAPSGVAEKMAEELEGSAYDPGEIAIIVNAASQAIADGAPAGTTSAVLNALIDDDTSFEEFVERMEQFTDLIEAGTPPGNAMNEVLGKGNAKK